MLRLLVDPGRASSRNVADVLSEIIVLGRLSGINIARLEAGDCRTCDLTRLRTSSRNQMNDAGRTVLDLHLTNGDEGPSPLWDQFQASLCMIVPLDAGLAGMFPLGEPTPADHNSRTIAREAVGLATREAPQLAAQNPISRPGSVPVDLITRQLQKIEGLLRRLASDGNATFELARPDHRTAKRASGPRRWFWRGKKFWFGSIASASAVGLGAAAYWWSAIASLLGLAGE
jgi:hypothetical protein